MLALFFFILFWVGLYAFYSIFKYTRMIANIFLSLVFSPPPENIAAARGEKVIILDSSDQEMEALVLETPKASRIAIFCHESGSSKESWEKYIWFLPGLGFHVLSVDLKGKSDPSEKNSLSQWPTQENVERVVIVIRWATRLFSEKMPIVLFGVSHGADTAFAASFEHPAVQAVVADGLFSMKEIFRDYIRKWAPILVRPNLFGEHYPRWVVSFFTNLGFWYCQRESGKKFVDVEHLLSKKHVPLLMIHGQEDDYIPPAHQKFLNLRNRQGTSLHLVIAGAGHNDAAIKDRQTYENAITQFLENRG